MVSHLYKDNPETSVRIHLAKVNLFGDRQASIARTSNRRSELSWLSLNERRFSDFEKPFESTDEIVVVKEKARTRAPSYSII